MKELQKAGVAKQRRKRDVQLCYYNLKSNLKYVDLYVDFAVGWTL